MAAGALTQACLPVPPTTPEQQHAAALYAASRSHDAADCRQLLDALGLLGIERIKPQRGRPRKTYDHGQAGMYARGCRCQECKDANARRCRQQRQDRAANPAAADRAGHGKASTYNNYGCRCEKCTRANAARSLAYKTARRAKARAAA